MITINKKKYAESEKEFVNSLFSKDGTCFGYAKRYKRSIVLWDHNKIKVGGINKYGVIYKTNRYGLNNYDMSINISEQQDLVNELSVRGSCLHRDIEYWFK